MRTEESGLARAKRARAFASLSALRQFARPSDAYLALRSTSTGSADAPVPSRA